MHTIKALVLVGLTPVLAVARPIEIGVTLGGHAFSESSELGTDDRMDDPGLDAAGLFGLRLGLPLTKRLAVEGEAVSMASHDDVLGDDVTVYGLRTHLRVDVLTGRIKPFVLAGLGVQMLRTGSPQMANDTDLALHVGLGVSVAVSSRIALRVDLRELAVPDRSTNGAASDVELSAGVTYRFGDAPAPRPVIRQVVVAAPAVDPDPDQDGIVGRWDRCPDVAEIRNGWQDDDGCPDERITELGGIGFTADSARIDASSLPLLEHAREILAEHVGLTVEIAGYTSAEGTPDRNDALSLARASAVKAWLVEHGIAPARLLAVGYGADDPIASNATEDGRRTNRRIVFRIIATP